VRDIVLRLLEDDWLEVREKASQVLGGLLHCDFVESTEDLIVSCRLWPECAVGRPRPSLSFYSFQCSACLPVKMYSCWCP
jgi:hypothetical protein